MNEVKIKLVLWEVLISFFISVQFGGFGVRLSLGPPKAVCENETTTTIVELATGNVSVREREREERLLTYSC